MLRFCERLLSPAVLFGLILLAITLMHSHGQPASSERRDSAAGNWVIGSNIQCKLLPAIPTDDDLLRLNHPEKIGALLLANTNVSDRGLAIIAHTRRLNMLDISNTRAGSQTLARLQNVRQLDGLFLTNLAIGDDDVVHLRELPITGLTLAGTQVTDAGMLHLACLTQLQHLDISDTKISDKSVPTLIAYAHLVNLSVGNTQISSEGLAAIRAARPDVSVKH